MLLRKMIDGEKWYINDMGLNELELYANSGLSFEQINESREKAKKELRVEFHCGDSRIDVLPIGEIQNTEAGQSQNIVAVYSFKGIMTDSASEHYDYRIKLKS
jgi:hypothetical protein